MDNTKVIRKWEDLINLELLGKNIYLYGAGVRLHYFLEAIQEQHIKLDIKNIIVTYKSGNSDYIKGIPVIDVDKSNLDKDDVVFLTVSELYINEIVDLLESKFGLDNIYTIDYAMINEFPLKRVYQMIEPFVSDYPKYCLNINCPESRSITIWTCWWQGNNLAPELIQACWRSWKLHVPKEIKIIVITKDNYEQYIEIPRYILDKVNNRSISLATLSDIIRHSLLYRYGGMWLDATIYMTDDMPSEVFEYDIYTRNIKTHEFGSNACWAGWFLFAKSAGQELFKFVMEAFFFFFKQNDTIPYYLMIDYLTAIASNEIKEVEKKLNDIPCNNIKALELAKHLNEPFVYDNYIEYTSGGFIQKLTRHGESYEKNSFYQYIINNMGDQYDRYID